MAYFPTAHPKQRFALIIANCTDLDPVHNDILLSYVTLKKLGFVNENIRYLTCDYKAKIMDEVDKKKIVPRNLIVQIKSYADFLNQITLYMSKLMHSRGEKDFFFAISSHGGQKYTRDLQEKDGLDEFIIIKGNVFTDDQIYNSFIHPLTSDTNVFIMVDTCHSGTMCDLNYVNGKQDRTDKNTKANVYCFSACSDNESAWGAISTNDRTFGGTTFVSLYDFCYKSKYFNILSFSDSAKSRLSNSFYKQSAVLSQSRMDVNNKFTLIRKNKILGNDLGKIQDIPILKSRDVVKTSNYFSLINSFNNMCNNVYL